MNAFKIDNMVIRGTTKAPSRTLENKRLRIELATAYRAFDRMNFNEGIHNHLTALAPAADGSDKEVLLVIPFGARWSEITPSMLIGVNENNEVVEGSGDLDITAVCVHRGARLLHKHLSVMHLHSPYATALSCLKDPELLMCHQESTLFHDDIVYDHDFHGFADSSEESQRIGRLLGDKRVMMMGNHGQLAVASSVAKTFDDLFILERCCMYQILAMSTGKPIKIIPEDVVKKVSAINFQSSAQKHLISFVRMFAKEDNEFTDHPDLHK